MVFRIFIFYLSFCLEIYNALKLGVLYSKGVDNKATLERLTRMAEEEIKADVISNFSIVTKPYNSSSSRDIILKTCDLIGEHVPLIVSTSSTTETKLQINTAQSFHIPVISVSATGVFLNTVSTPFLLSLSPSDFYQTKVIYDILVRYKWYEVTLMSSVDSYGINGLLWLHTLLSKNENFYTTDVVYIQSASANYGSQELMRVKLSLSMVIVLNCPAAESAMILEKAEKLDMLTAGYVWIVTDSLTSHPKSLANNYGNFDPSLEGLIGIGVSLEKSRAYLDFKMRYLARYPNETTSDLGIYETLFYDGIKLAASHLKNLSVFYHKTDVTCASTTSWNRGNYVMKHLLSSNYSGITGSFNFNENGETTRVLYDVLNFKYDVFQKVGAWANNTQLYMQDTITFLGGIGSSPPGVPQTLSGYHFKLGVIVEPPFVLKSKNCNGTNCYSGYCVDLVSYLSKDLGFTYEFVEPEDQHYGIVDLETGEWNGMVADLMNKKIDMITTILSKSSLRKEVIDFSASFMDSGITAVVHGETHGKNLLFFLSPLSSEVWILVIVCNVIVTAIICFLSKSSPYGKYGSKILAMQTCPCESCKDMVQKRKCEGKNFRNIISSDCLLEKCEEENTMDDLSFFNSAWLVTVGLVGQAAEALPYCASARSLLFTWWLFILIVFSMYTANLTAFLTLSNMGVDIHSVKGLLKQEKYKWGILESTYLENLLLNNLDEDYIRIANEAEKFKNLTDALKRVDEGGFVFIDEAPVLTHRLNDNCDFIFIGNEFQKFVYSFGLPKNAPFATLINTKMLQLREDGLMDNLWSKWSSNHRVCSKKVGNKKRLNFLGLSGVFCVLLGGVIIALVIQIIEYIICARSLAISNKSSVFSALANLVRLKVENIQKEWLGRSPAQKDKDSSSTKSGVDI